MTLLAALLGVRAVILEPNARPGFTNRVLKPFVRAGGLRLRGGPGGLRRARASSPATPCAADSPRSPPQGAPRAAHPARLRGQPGLAGRSTGRSSPPCPACRGRSGSASSTRRAPRCATRWQAAYRAAGREAEVPAFLDDMERRFGEADLVLSRSGATTCAELTVAGRAAILVPFALAADDHQRTNARALEAGGAARMLEEKDLTGRDARRPRCAALVDDPQRIRAMEEAARRLVAPGRGRPRGGPPRGPRGGDACLGRSSTSTSSGSAARG